MSDTEQAHGKRINDQDDAKAETEQTPEAKRAKAGDSDKPTDSQQQPARTFLGEADVGITQFITPGWGGFDAIIKHRFADFFVNEIDQEGSVVHLTSYTDAVDPEPPKSQEEEEIEKLNVPEDPQEAFEEAFERLKTVLGDDDAYRGSVVHLTSYTDAVDPEPPKSQEEEEIEKLNVPEDPQEAFEEAFERLKTVLGDDDAYRIKRHLEATEEQTREQRTLLLDRELDKDQRTFIYSITNNFLPTQVTCETVDGKMTFVRRVAGSAEKPARRRRGRGPEWHHLGDYCYFVMQKENRESMDVMHQIARSLKIKPRLLGVAGTKDKRGITVQRCSAYRVDHTRLMWASKKLQGARLGNFSYGDRELRLGDLGGNQFRVVLRHVQGADEQSLQPVLEGIRDTGFINYYGMQRFGTNSIPSHSIGIAVLKADWHEATDLVLRPRPGDRPDVEKARKIWVSTKDAKATLAALPQRSALAEHSILQQFSKQGNATNAAAAFAAVPRNLRLMYVHAYQSYIWNSAVSKRIELFGVQKPVPGDLVVKAQGFSSKALPDSSEEADGSEEDEAAVGDAGRVEPVLVTAENADQFSIYDVVLPLPGWAVKYPEHQVKSVYKDLMEEDGLSPFSLDKHPVKEYKLAGAYRHMVIKPRDFAYEWMRYNNDKLPLARSDSDAIEGKHVPESIEFGEHVALKLAFDLPSSAYATMLLRELMRQETASGHQTRLSTKAGC
ncbi:tRNA pseudouridine synthase D [Martensiomyces pterosporus]|nr:tRNA pseudouridine synthase D [Martensiomyces pterosporus]